MRDFVDNRGGFSSAGAGKDDNMFLGGKGDFLLAGIEGNVSPGTLILGHASAQNGGAETIGQDRDERDI